MCVIRAGGDGGGRDQKVNWQWWRALLLTVNVTDCSVFLWVWLAFWGENKSKPQRVRHHVEVATAVGRVVPGLERLPTGPAAASCVWPEQADECDYRVRSIWHARGNSKSWKYWPWPQRSQTSGPADRVQPPSPPTCLQLQHHHRWDRR